VVSLWSKPKPKRNIKNNMSPGLILFFRENRRQIGCPRAVKAWIDLVLVGNDAFAPGGCHGGNNSLLKKMGSCGFANDRLNLTPSRDSFVLLFYQ
jgi:hypothetical protein